jgi:hypothetical protein
LRAYQNNLQKLFVLAKWVLVPAILLFIGYKLFGAYDLDTLIHTHQFTIDSFHLMVLVVAILLMPANIFLESIKWKLLLNKHEQVSLKWAFQSVVSGLSLSIITPNQLGDFAGRILKLKEMHKVKGALVAVVGHTSQMFWITLSGLIAFSLIPELLAIDAKWQIYVQILMVVFAIGFMVFYLNMRGLSKLIKLPKIKFYTDVFGAYNTKELMMIWSISGLRYFIYSSQYVLLIYFFDTGITTWQAIAAVSATLCAQIFMPSFLIVEIGLRGVSALWFLGKFSDQYVSILLSAYSLWILNIMIPALYGLFIFSTTKLSKNDH